MNVQEIYQEPCSGPETRIGTQNSCYKVSIFMKERLILSNGNGIQEQHLCPRANLTFTCELWAEGGGGGGGVALSLGVLETTAR